MDLKVGDEVYLFSMPCGFENHVEKGIKKGRITYIIEPHDDEETFFNISFNEDEASYVVKKRNGNDYGIIMGDTFCPPYLVTFSIESCINHAFEYVNGLMDDEYLNIERTKERIESYNKIFLNLIKFLIK